MSPNLSANRKTTTPGNVKVWMAVVAFLLTSITVNAKDYYFSSSSGDDSYTSVQAQSQATPWKSIARLNSFFNNLTAGDNIYFERGDVFYGSIVVTRSGTSGNPITIGAYGTGNKPLITGLVALTSWSATSGGVYQVTAPAVKSSVNLVTLNGVPQAVGRYPNADAANGGYLTYESFSSVPGNYSITDKQLSSGTDWTGAEAVIRKQHYAMEKCKITDQTNGVLSYTTTQSIDPLNNSDPLPVDGTNGFGYFIQRDPRTLDQLGEWYFNGGSKKMQMYFGSNDPSNYDIEATTIDTLINIGTNNYINVNDIAFQGANVAAIYAANAGNLTVQSCDMNLMGGKGILFFDCSNVLVDGVTTSDVLCGAIDVTSRVYNNATITNCVVQRTGLLAGMGSFWDDNDYKAVTISVKSDALVEFNTIDSTGFVGIQFEGSNVTIQHNFVNYYDIVKDDGGGIYYYHTGTDADPGVTYTNRTINQNIVMHGIGANKGTTGDIDVDGIFLDGRSTNVNILNNTMANIGVNGIYSNNAINVNIRGNTSFNNGSGMGISRYAFGVFNNFSVKQNIFFPKYSNQINFNYADQGVDVPATSTIQTRLQNLGQIDSNYYATPDAVGFNYWFSLTNGGAWSFPKPLSFEGWKALTGHDGATKLPPVKIATYKLNKVIGSNLVTNGQFTSNINNITVWSPTVNMAFKWDNTNKITGTGSLKITPLLPKTDFTFLYGKIGSISSSKNYILRVTTRGTASNGVLMATIRQEASPQTALAPIQTVDFGTSKEVHEFLFTAPADETTADFLIEIQQSSGIVYVDDIQFYQADATLLDIDDQLRFEYNPTNISKTISLDANYRGLDSTVYSGSFTLAPYTSKILIKDTSIVIKTTALIASATAPPVTCVGSATTVTVTASGGMTPYSGTGTFSVTAGRGSLKLSVPNPVAGDSTFLYSTIGAITNTKNYVLKLSTLGTTNNGSLTVYLRKTNAPYTRLSPILSKSFGTSRIDHQFVFNAPGIEDTASFLIAIDQASGTTYIDNVAFFEADASGNAIGDNLYDNGQFESDISNITSWSPSGNHVTEWDSTSKISNTYFYTVTDEADNTSVAAVTVVQPSAPLKASANANDISVYNGSTTVNVTATGGTAPYSGTGSFTVKAGTYTYTVQDANGCSTVTAITVNQPLPSGTPLVADAEAPAINCFGNSTTATVTASGGTAPYTGTGSFLINAGKGSLKVSSTSPDDTKLTLIYGAIGGVLPSKTYVLRFSTLGTTDNGNLKASLRESDPNWYYLTPVQYATFGTSRVDHQFIFTAPTQESNSSFLIEVRQSSGTVYIDNIAFFEADSVGNLLGPNLYQNGQFETDISGITTWSVDSSEIAVWDGTSKISNTYYYSITDASGNISTTHVDTYQPALPLQVNVSASATDANGNAIVSVTATGGTSPYSGTGSYSVSQGSYTYTVTDANGCNSTSSVTIGPSGSRTMSSAAVLGSNALSAPADLINNENTPLKISSYPNPAVSEFGLVVQGGTSEMVNISVQSIDGRILYKAKGSSNNKYVFGNNFVPGIYIVNVIQGNNSQVLRVVKGSF